MTTIDMTPSWVDFDLQATYTDDNVVSAHGKAPGEQEKGEIYFLLEDDTRDAYCVVAPFGFGQPQDPVGLNDRERILLTHNLLRRHMELLPPKVRIIVLDENQQLLAASPDPTERIGLSAKGLDSPFSSFTLHRWHENLTIQFVPAHPHVAPVHHGLLGIDRSAHDLDWTSKHWDEIGFPSDKSQFKMKWLKQLTDTIDYLHLELGICHNDLQIKNIMIDRPTDKLLLAGFELTCPVSDYGMQYELNQVTWLLYALVTHDFTNAETHFLAEEQLCDTKDFEYEVFGNFYSDVHDTAEWYNSTRSIDEIPEWPVRVQLDCECYELRQYVKSWIQRRKSISIPTPKTSLSFDIRKFDFSEASVSVKMEELEEWQMDEDTEPTNFNQCNVKAYPDPVGKASDSLITVDPMEWDLVSDSDSEINFPVHLKRTAGDDDEEPPTQKRTRMSSPEEDPVECLCQHLARDSLIEDIEFDADMAFIVYGQECPVHEEEWRAKYSGDNVDFRQ